MSSDSTNQSMALRLSESERQLRIIFDSTGTSNSIFDQDCRLIRQNALSVAQLGLPEDEARGKHVTELFGPDQGRIIEARMRRVMATGVSETFDTRFDLPGGRKVFRSSYQVLTDSGRVVGLQIISQDITEQVRAQELLEEQQSQFRAVFELAADLVCIASLEGVFQLVNPAGKALLGYPDEVLLHRPFLEFIAPEDRDKTVRVIEERLAKGETVLEFENRYQTFAGAIIHLEWVARADLERGLIFAVARDMTARRRFEAEKEAIDLQIRKTQKLESLGILAGGIAHDFNNILAGILGFVELATSVATHPDHRNEKMVRYLERIQGGCVRAQALTRQLLTFAKGGVPVLKVVDPGPLIESAVMFASHGNTARTEVRIEPGLPPVACDPEQISQVVSNLVINAHQAMEGVGTLIVTVAPDHGHIVCRFTDTGPGIPAELQDKIFDPFFTTKRNGTGLGLSICHSIVHSHRGALTVESELGVGATFVLRLPSEPTGLGTPEPSGCPLAHHGCGRALVFDDEEPIRMAVAEILEMLGYEAVTAASSADLRRWFEPPQGPPSVCLLDLTTPGDRGGAAWAHELRDRGYEGFLVAISGYSQDPVMARPRSFGFDAALAKPFRSQDLAQVLESLGKKEPSSAMLAP